MSVKKYLLMSRAVWLAVYGLVRTPPMLGLALIFIFFSTALVYAWPMTRNVERDLPDHSAVEPATVVEA